MDKRVLVGVSGGIDSAAVVMMLRERGYEVVAMWIDMLGLESQRDEVVRLCKKLEVKLIVKDAKDEFQRLVVDRVLSEHRMGRTPSPCTICNPLIKWKLLWEEAVNNGCSFIATGHYISITGLCEKLYLECGIDPVKDQSYYLWAMGVEQEILSKTLTPLGKYLKSEVRSYVESRGYGELCGKRESQSLCFVMGRYGDFLRRNISAVEGDLVDQSGRVVGQHCGAALYTIGQKRGFEYYGEQSVEVRAIDTNRNIVTVGSPLNVTGIVMSDGWFAPIDDSEIRAKIRGIGVNPQRGVSVNKLSDGRYEIITSCDEVFWAPALSQPVVLFQGTIVVGGGVLESV